jgi:hypothetical protein
VIDVPDRADIYVRLAALKFFLRHRLSYSSAAAIKTPKAKLSGHSARGLGDHFIGY